MTKVAHATLQRREGDKTITQYHSTDVVTETPDKIILDSGGWETVTTKRRMNQYTPPYIKVFQRDYRWYVQHDRQHVTYPFEDGIELER